MTSRPPATSTSPTPATLPVAYHASVEAPQHPGRPLKPSPGDRVGPAQLPERQHHRRRITTQQGLQQRRAGRWQANHHHQRPRQRHIEQAWAAADLVPQPCLGDRSPDQLAAQPDPPTGVSGAWTRSASRTRSPGSSPTMGVPAGGMPLAAPAAGPTGPVAGLLAVGPAARPPPPPPWPRRPGPKPSPSPIAHRQPSRHRHGCSPKEATAGVPRRAPDGPTPDEAPVSTWPAKEIRPASWIAWEVMLNNHDGSPPIPSPISVTPITSSTTARITALLRRIQPLRRPSGSADRLPIAK
jgi:hypothetical protein